MAFNHTKREKKTTKVYSKSHHHAWFKHPNKHSIKYPNKHSIKYPNKHSNKIPSPFVPLHQPITRSHEKQSKGLLIVTSPRMHQTSKKTFNHTSNQTFNQTFNHTSNQTFNQTFNHTSNETFNQTFNLPTSHHITPSPPSPLVSSSSNSFRKSVTDMHNLSATVSKIELRF